MKYRLPNLLSNIALNLVKPKDRLLFSIKSLFSPKTIRLLLLTLVIIVVLPPAFFVLMRPKPQKDINYGVSFSKKYAVELGLDWKKTYISMLDDLGAEYLRLITYWDEVETAPNSYDWSNIKWQLQEAQKRNLSVILTIGRKVPRWPECFEPTWWKQIESNDKQNEELYEYVTKAVLELREYRTIKMWQVENEPFFPFGECPILKRGVVANEMALVKKLDSRPVITQDSGEGGVWFPSYMLGDGLAISMYRKIWYNFWGTFFGKFIYFKYPLSHWTYKIKADLVGVPYQKIIVTELQAEPWGPDINSRLSQEEKDKSMSRQDFIDTINYAQKSGFKSLYFWGAEWWFWEKEFNNNPFFWDTAKALFN